MKKTDLGYRSRPPLHRNPDPLFPVQGGAKGVWPKKGDPALSTRKILALAMAMSLTLSNLRLLAEAIAAEAAAADAPAAADADADADASSRREIQRLQRLVAALESQRAAPHDRGTFPWCGGRYEGEWRGRLVGEPRPGYSRYMMMPHGDGRLVFPDHTQEGRFDDGGFRDGVLIYPDGTQEPFPLPKTQGQWDGRQVWGQGDDVGPWELTAARFGDWQRVTCRFHAGFCLVVTPTRRMYCTHNAWGTWVWCKRGAHGTVECAKSDWLRVALYR